MPILKIKYIIVTLLKNLIPEKYHILLVNGWVKLKYGGNEFICPFCERKYKKLSPIGKNTKSPVYHDNNVIGAGYRPNASCPHPECISSDKERLLYFYLKHKTNIFSENLRVLHIAPERNLHKLLKKQNNLDYISGDLNHYGNYSKESSPLDYYLRRTKPTLAMGKVDITNIKYKDNSFDVIICNHVLEHVPDDKLAMSELNRVLKPGGWAIIDVPYSFSLTDTIEDSSITDPKEREITFGQWDHLRIYGAEDFKNRLKSAGFKVNLYDLEEESNLDDISLYALPKNHKLHICLK